MKAWMSGKICSFKLIKTFFFLFVCERVVYEE